MIAALLALQTREAKLVKSRCRPFGRVNRRWGPSLFMQKIAFSQPGTQNLGQP